MATVTDNFTDTTGTVLTAHTSDSGATWASSAASVAGVLAGIDAANRLHITTTVAGSQVLSPSVAAGGPDQIVAASFTNVGGTIDGTPGLLARLTDSATPTFYMARFNVSRWEIYKCVAGALTRIDSNVATQSLGTTPVVARFEVIGATQKLYLDNVLLISLTDSAITTGTSWGLRVSGVINSNTLNWRIDSLSFLDSVAAPVNTVAPVISGTRVVGQTLTTTSGTWTGSPSFTYQWRMDGVNVSGQTATTFAPTVPGVATCVVTAVNGSGTVSATSNALTVVAEAVPGDVQFWTSAASGLGGSPAALIPSPTSVFDSVSFAEATAGDVEYRLVYLKNTHAVRSIATAVVWVASQTTSPTTSIDIGVAAEPPGTDAAAIANESTAPAGVAFTAPATEGGALSVGTLAPGQARGVWLRWTVLAATAEAAADTASLGWSGTPA